MTEKLTIIDTKKELLQAADNGKRILSDLIQEAREVKDGKKIKNRPDLLRIDMNKISTDTQSLEALKLFNELCGAENLAEQSGGINESDYNNLLHRIETKEKENCNEEGDASDKSLQPLFELMREKNIYIIIKNFT